MKMTMTFRVWSWKPLTYAVLFATVSALGLRGQRYTSAASRVGTQPTKLESELFTFESGTRFGVIDSAGHFSPYSKREVGAIVKQQLRDNSCDDPQRIEDCFIRAVNDRYKTATGVYVDLREHGSLGQMLGYDLTKRRLHFELDRKNLPEQVAKSSIELGALTDGPKSVPERLKIDKNGWSLNGAHFAYGSNVVRVTGPFLRSHNAEQSSSPSDLSNQPPETVLTTEYYQSGTRRLIITLTDSDGDGTVDDVTFIHPYEAIPRASTNEKKRECVIYGTGLLGAPIRSAVTGVDGELIGLPTAPFATIKPAATTYGIEDSRLAKDRAVVNQYFKAINEVLTGVDRKLTSLQ